MSFLLFRNAHDLHQLKKSVAPPSDYSGYEYEHRNHVNRFYNSSAPVCVLQTGAFCRYRGCFYRPRAPPLV